MSLITTATHLGDAVADPYAALAGQLGAQQVIGMLRRACRDGVDAVPDAPEELRAFIADMERRPTWLDMDRIERGATASRVPSAFLTPYLIRGVFLATFTNTYAALPMTLTGTLSGRRAARRVHETAYFFSVTTLPGALERHGPGFEAAAMVRLMHSMVRWTALTRGGWDAATFGLPIPQVDQMPAGLVNMYLLARGALAGGRTEFTEEERDVLEFCRYRCFLLGLPEELLPTDAEEIVRVFHARAATLRHGFDDATCGELVRSTMAARLQPGQSRRDDLLEFVEQAWSRVSFCRAFAGGDRQRSATMSVPVTLRDLAVIALTTPFVLGRTTVAARARRVRVLAGPVDAWAQRVLRSRLGSYGHPEFSADPDRTDA